MRGDPGDSFEDDRDRLREEDEVCGGGFFEGCAAIDHVQLDGLFDGGGGADAEDSSMESGLAER